MVPAIRAAISNPAMTGPGSSQLRDAAEKPYQVDRGKAGCEATAKGSNDT
jgi:hypothetical protein